MSESRNEGHKPSAGELQARPAERIIKEAQMRPHQSGHGAEGASHTSSAYTKAQQENFDARKYDGVLEYLKEWGERVTRKHGEPQTEKYKYPHVITPHGVATNPEELRKLHEMQRIETQKNLERMQKEAAARIEATSRLPFGQKLLCLISWRLVDPEVYNPILEQVRREMGLTND